jgi:hypothetical protein
VARLSWLLFLPLVACAPMKAPMKVQAAKIEAGYTGIVQKVFRVVRRGADLPGVDYLGKAGGILSRALRQNAETHQYIVRTPKGEIIAQSDEEFPVGQCVAVIPEVDRSGPAFRYGEAAVVRSESCHG